MTPERATELLNHTTAMSSPLDPLWRHEARTIEVGNIRKHMTEDEIRFVTAYWKRLPGSSSFYTTLLRIAAGEYEPA